MRSFLTFFILLFSAMLTSALVVRDTPSKVARNAPSKVARNAPSKVARNGPSHVPRHQPSHVPRSGPSGVPCVYTCPHKDNSGNPLGTHTEGDNISCYYPDYNKYCFYDKKTGKLTYDYDGGHCPQTAVCGSHSRREALPKSPRKKTARQVDAAEELKVRDQLGSAKRSKRSFIRA